MRVVCVVVPHFLVEVERLHNTLLRGRPVVVGGAPERGLGAGGWGLGKRSRPQTPAPSPQQVLDCSPEAMERGVRPGMSLREALSRCASAVFVEAHPYWYETTTMAIVGTLVEISPFVEPAGPGVFYLGVDRYCETSAELKVLSAETQDSGLRTQHSHSHSHSHDAELEATLVQAIMAAAERASGLVVQVGLADGKFAAYVAAKTKVLSAESAELPPVARPDAAGAPREAGRGIVPRSSAAGTQHSALSTQYSTLGRLSIDDLPVSVEMQRRLSLFGIRTVGDFSRLPRSAVTAQFGLEGARAWDLAHGIDREPIVPYRPPVTITERLAFPAPVDTADALLAAVRTLLGRALHRPQSRGRAARGLRLLVHLEGGHTWESRISFREPVGSAERMLVALKPRIEAATREVLSPESQHSALGSQHSSPGLGAPFTEVELSLLGICGESALQGNLFASQRGRQLERVAEAARQLKSRYGRPILTKVVEVEPWSRIPERRFALIDYDP